MNEFGFDMTQIEVKDGNYNPLPAGKYNVEIKKAETKITKDGTGKYLSVGVQVTGPTHVNRYLFDNINFLNKNHQTQEIGREQLTALCAAANVNLANPTSKAL